ncbi:unnamed protein product [Malus baccata var. baccata]
MRKLLEFDFLATVDRAINDKAAKIRTAKDEVSNELGWHEPHGKIGMAGSHGARLAQL